jgi:hypothetical protein
MALDIEETKRQITEIETRDEDTETEHGDFYYDELLPLLKIRLEMLERNT